MNAACLRIFAAALAYVILAAGCLVVPLEPFAGEPYAEALLAKLSQRADRSEVRRALGQPTATRAGETYWFYAREIPVAGIIGGTGSAVMTRLEWVAVEFDDSGRVSFLGRGRDEDACLANGICNYSRMLLKHSPADAAITAPAIQDAEAKALVPRHECAVYFYWEPAGVKRMSGPVTLAVDGREHGVSEYRSYLFFTHAPGTIRMKAFDAAGDIECRSGEKLYVKGMNTWSQPRGSAVLRVSAAEGETEIRSRRLALPR
jgi:hypothetical protein